MDGHVQVITYDEAGEGPPLLLVHGHPFDRTMWRPQVERFGGAGYRVITPDLRGYGASAGEVESWDRFARDVAELLDGLGIARVAIGGVSMGGQIVMEFCRLLPERVRALVLSDTSPTAETAEGRRIRYDMAERLLREGMGGYADEVLAKMIAPYNVAALPEVAAHVLGMMRATRPEGAAAALRARAERPDYRELLAGVRAPTLVVVGADDEFTPVAVARETRDLVPGAELVVVDGAGHLPNMEQPHAFNEALAAFLESVER
jgi:pimeloyl-ACP methyl ester carboxylesterase